MIFPAASLQLIFTQMSLCCHNCNVEQCFSFTPNKSVVRTHHGPDWLVSPAIFHCWAWRWRLNACKVRCLFHEESISSQFQWNITLYHWCLQFYTECSNELTLNVHLIVSHYHQLYNTKLFLNLIRQKVLILVFLTCSLDAPQGLTKRTPQMTNKKQTNKKTCYLRKKNM